jgi:hypothetical protein
LSAGERVKEWIVRRSEEKAGSATSDCSYGSKEKRCQLWLRRPAFLAARKVQKKRLERGQRKRARKQSKGECTSRSTTERKEAGSAASALSNKFPESAHVERNRISLFVARREGDRGTRLTG